MFEESIYSAGLYLRLSKDDDGRSESVSIGTQRDILTDYCSKKGFAIHDVYIDDGYSGLNFNRPRFQEMLDDIESGRINILYPYILQQVRSFAASMKRRKVNSHLANYADIEELTPEILEDVIERIEISHVSRKAKPGSVIHIYWKLQ